MDHVEDFLLVLREHTDDDLPRFTDIVRKAFRESDPVFFRERYSEFFFKCASTIPGYIGNCVVANADKESEGSSGLFALWQGAAANAAISKDLLFHAKDESRHSKLFIEMSGLAFPWQFSQESCRSKRSELFTITPEMIASGQKQMRDEDLMDHLVQMNMGEIRTRLHVAMLAPVIFAFTPADNKPRVKQILEGLVLDEIRHISYTARFIEAWCDEGATQRIADLYNRRLRDFHRLTVEQTESSVRAYGAGQFPDLLEI